MRRTCRAGKVDNRKSDMNVISSFEYVRDANGNPLSIAREDDAVVYYEYDAKNQLTSEIQRRRCSWQLTRAKLRPMS